MRSLERLGSVNLVHHRGQKLCVSFPVAHLAAGSTLQVTVHAIVGGKPGPTVTLLGAQHGNEIGSVAGIQSVVTRLDPSEIRGTVLAIPVSNPLAFDLGARSTWVDAMYGGTTGNLNRAWPGKADGFLTERLARVITDEVLGKSDCILDFHASTVASISIYYGYAISGDDPVAARAREIALAFGMEIMLSETAPDTGSTGRKLLDFAVRDLKIPCSCFELGEFYGFGPEKRLIRTPQETAVTGVLNVLKHLGMLPGTPKLPARQLVIAPEQRCQPSQGGLLYPSVSRVDIGSVLVGGSVLGEVYSPYTFELLDKIVAPFPESVLLSALDPQGFSKVNPGDQAFHCGDLTRAHWIDNDQKA